ncbi:MAG: HD domain-containing protein [Candidatus Omnitrophota bacterium]
MSLAPEPQTKKLLQDILCFSRKKKAGLYLVGGYLRDLVLRRRRQNPDIDICLQKGAISFGGTLARYLKAGFVVLDREHGSCRLVKNIKDRVYTLDFSDWRGPTLQDDLLHRDFTINTMALGLEDALVRKPQRGSWIDLYGAGKDLKAKLIRIVNPRAFDEDPLRILRAFSLAAILGFKIEKQTLSLAQAKAAKLRRVSFERIRDELFKILDTPHSYKHFLLMDGLGILRFIIPEFEPMRGVNQGPYHHLDILKHTFETLRQLELLLEELRYKKQLSSYLDESLSAGRRRLALLKLGALLHDVGKPRARRREGSKIKFHGHERIGCRISGEISRRLRLSNSEWRALEKMVFWHLRPGYLGDNEEPTRRAIFRYMRDTAEEAASVLLVSLADQRATRGSLTTRSSRLRHERVCFRLIGEYFKEKKKKSPEKFVTGDDLIRELGLSPSPLIGKLLRELRELQAIGRITNRQQALEAAGKYLKR